MIEEVLLGSIVAPDTDKDISLLVYDPETDSAVEVFNFIGESIQGNMNMSTIYLASNVYLSKISITLETSSNIDAYIGSQDKSISEIVLLSENTIEFTNINPGTITPFNIVFSVKDSSSFSGDIEFVYEYE